MLRRLFLLSVAFLLASAILPAPESGRLEIATASVEITGPPGYPMGGYSARRGVNEGTHDPLLAKVLLIRSGDQQLGIVTLDVLAFVSEKIPRQAREWGIPHLIQVASHTHSGPFPRNRETFRSDPWVLEAEEKVLQAIRAAQSRYVPARMSVAEGSVQLGHNRRRVEPDGTVTMFWRNAERLPTSPVDPTVGIIRFTDPAGKVLAVIVNYACHAVVLGPDNLRYSADWPGFMYRSIEEKLGPPAMCFFVPGAAGDINPYNDKQPVEQDGFGVARQVGETIGAEVLRAMESMPAGAADAPLRIAQEEIVFEDRFDAQKKVPVQLSYVMLGGDTAFLAVPGEVFVRHQIDLREMSPLPHTYLFGYAYSGSGDFAGYLPTIQAAMEGGYGASYATRIEVGAAERIIDRAVIRFAYWTGKLKPRPGPP